MATPAKTVPIQRVNVAPDTRQCVKHRSALCTLSYHYWSIQYQFKQSQLSALWSTLWASELAALDKYLITLATELQF